MSGVRGVDEVVERGGIVCLTIVVMRVASSHGEGRVPSRAGRGSFNG
jgi:hypothetical protein